MRTIFAALVMIVLAGCAGTNFSYDRARQVQVGMTEAEVTKIMGPPYSVSSAGGSQMWIWSHANGMTGSSRAVSFKMQDGVVVEVPQIPASFK